MDESRDEQLEVLDVGGLRSRGWTDADRPVIQLDDQPFVPSSDRSPSLRLAVVVLDEAATFDDAGVDFHVNDDRRVYGDGWIPAAAVAALARYALTVCDE